MSLPWNGKCDIGHVLIEFNMRKALVVYEELSASSEKMLGKIRKKKKKKKSNIYSVNY